MCVCSFVCALIHTVCVNCVCVQCVCMVCGRTPTFQSLHGNLLEFVCLALKSSLGSRAAHRDGAARSPSGRPNEDAALNLANLWGTPHTHVSTHQYTHGHILCCFPLELGDTTAFGFNLIPSNRLIDINTDIFIY